MQPLDLGEGRLQALLVGAGRPPPQGERREARVERREAHDDPVDLRAGAKESAMSNWMSDGRRRAAASARPGTSARASSAASVEAPRPSRAAEATNARRVSCGVGEAKKHMYCVETPSSLPPVVAHIQEEG
jgi:hypothetical protein